MPTLDELLTPPSRDQIRQRLIEALRDMGFPLNDFNPGAVGRHVAVEAPALGLEDLWRMVAAIARGGYLSTASGPWLDLLAEEFYNLKRKPAAFACGVVRLSAAPGFGPYEIGPGDLWVGTADGKRYSAITGGTLPQGGSLELMVRAESPGAAYNVPDEAITVLHTPLPGVSVVNPAGWLVEAGADEETDEALRLRCRLRWASLGTGATADAYRFWALSAHPSITKVRVLDQHPRGQGTVDVVIWGEGGLGEEAVNAANAYIQERRPLTADVLVYAATPKTIPVVARITVRAGYLSAVQADVTEKLAALQRGLPIGGTVYRSALIDALFGSHVVNVQLTAPAEDITLGAVEAAVFSPSLTYQEV